MSASSRSAASRSWGSSPSGSTHAPLQCALLAYDADETALVRVSWWRCRDCISSEKEQRVLTRAEAVRWAHLSTCMLSDVASNHILCRNLVMVVINAANSRTTCRALWQHCAAITSIKQSSSAHEEHLTKGACIEESNNLLSVRQQLGNLGYLELAKKLQVANMRKARHPRAAFEQRKLAQFLIRCWHHIRCVRCENINLVVWAPGVLRAEICRQPQGRQHALVNGVS
jgi:hypothetical protein